MKLRGEENLSASAQRALENYPQIQASPDFNRRVLERVLAAPAPSRLELFCDRLDEIFAQPVLKLFSVACLGVLVALAGTGLLFGLPAPSTPVVTANQNAPLAAQLSEETLLDSHNRLALMRELEIPYALRHEYFGRNLHRSDAPAKREKSADEMPDHQRSSRCLATFHDLA